MVFVLSDIGLLRKGKTSLAGVREIAEYVERGADSVGQWCAENVN